VVPGATGASVYESPAKIYVSSGKKKLPVKVNGRLARARAALAEQPWGSISRDGLPVRFGAHWEAGCMCPRASFPPSSGYTAMSILCVEKRWKLEVVIIFGAAARYRRATAGSSHDDAHPDNFRPNTGFVVFFFFI